MKEKTLKIKILESIKDKAILKQLVYDNTCTVFENLKKVLIDLEKEFNLAVSEVTDDKRLVFKYEERSATDISLTFASEMLLFSMHTNVFQFNRDNEIWDNPYVMISPANAYSGMITIYNFLTDSFEMGRMDDLGYLVGRLFINRQNHFIVEGKRQIGFTKENFEDAIISPLALKIVVERAINYALNFDLLVPPYDNIKIASVAQMHEKVQHARIKTGKRLGFRFNSDDVK
ncbi:MAG: hypothetical protein WBG43_02480 [Marinifilaceae bacterium]